MDSASPSLAHAPRRDAGRPSAPALPEVFVVGAAKSGTTALYRYFELHPQVFVPATVKESNYMAFSQGLPPLRGPRDFSIVGRRSVTSLADYQNLYQPRAGELVAADCCPAYLYYPQASAKIKELVPRAKIVIILRNPVECAFSMYSMMRRDRREPCRSFWKAFNQSAARRAAGWEWAWDLQGCYQFAPQVRRYLDLFDASQLFLRQYDQLKHQPAQFYRELSAFLGVDTGDVEQANRQFNVSPRRVDMLKKYKLGRAMWYAGRWADHVAPRTVSHRVRRWMDERAFTLTAQDRCRLIEYFRGDIVELSKLLDWDLSSWLAA